MTIIQRAFPTQCNHSTTKPTSRVNRMSNLQSINALTTRPRKYRGRRFCTRLVVSFLMIMASTGAFSSAQEPVGAATQLIVPNPYGWKKIWENVESGMFSTFTMYPVQNREGMLFIQAREGRCLLTSSTAPNDWVGSCRLKALGEQEIKAALFSTPTGFRFLLQPTDIQRKQLIQKGVAKTQRHLDEKLESEWPQVERQLVTESDSTTVSIVKLEFIAATQGLVDCLREKDETYSAFFPHNGMFNAVIVVAALSEQDNLEAQIHQLDVATTDTTSKAPMFEVVNAQAPRKTEDQSSPSTGWLNALPDTVAARELLKKLRGSESAAASAANEIRRLQANGDAVETIAPHQAQLKAHLQTAFELKMQLEELQVKELQARLSRLERQIGQRKELREKIIDRRAVELLNPAVNWETTIQRNLVAVSPVAGATDHDAEHNRGPLTNPNVAILEKLQGTWVIEKANIGLETPAELSNGESEFTIKDLLITGRSGFGFVDSDVPIMLSLLDPEQGRPQFVNLYFDPNGEAMMSVGILECDGDRLRICFSHAGAPGETVYEDRRPPVFATGSKVTLVECRRKKDAAPQTTAEQQIRSEEQKLRWRSGIVEIFAEIKTETDLLQTLVGSGVLISSNGLVMSQLSAPPKNAKFFARLDDGSHLPLEIVEFPGSNLYVFQLPPNTPINHYFKLSGDLFTPLSEVYVFGKNTSSPENKLGLFTAQVAMKDRQVTRWDLVQLRLWQLVKPDNYGPMDSCPVLSAKGELLGMTLRDTGDLLLVLPVEELKKVFPKAFGEINNSSNKHRVEAPSTSVPQDSKNSAPGIEAPADGVDIESLRKSAIDSLQGTWCFDTLQSNAWPKPIGQPTDSSGRKSQQRWIIKGDLITWTSLDNEPIGVIFTIDPTKTPKQIDFTFLTGPQKGMKSVGIYEPQKGNANYLWLCMTNPGTNTFGQRKLAIPARNNNR